MGGGVVSAGVAHQIFFCLHSAGIFDRKAAKRQISGEATTDASRGRPKGAPGKMRNNIRATTVAKQIGVAAVAAQNIF